MSIQDPQLSNMIPTTETVTDVSVNMTNGMTLNTDYHMLISISSICMKPRASKSSARSLVVTGRLRVDKHGCHVQRQLDAHISNISYRLGTTIM